ncbi:unnamed protein product [Lactuca virosa]|uniref:Uncharacterized protein n=1 Tax=Lactuca virosa TaxID=75947 RepID=A0AAU9LEX0_9ASTR|nr:unnamed protein product [Lactuca virosa]
MGTIGKLVREVEIKSDINLVYEIYKHKPNNSAVISPDKVQGCDFVSGQCCDPGSVIGTSSMVIEGGVLEVYNPLILTVNIEDMSHKKLVTWTMDFEKVNG